MPPQRRMSALGVSEVNSRQSVMPSSRADRRQSEMPRKRQSMATNGRKSVGGGGRKSIAGGRCAHSRLPPARLPRHAAPPMGGGGRKGERGCGACR